MQDQLERLNFEALREAEDDKELDDAGRMVVHLHIHKPWIKSFKSVLISPLVDGLDDFLKEFVFEDEGVEWFYPSKTWWRAHVKTSHREGRGCNVDAHAEFLTIDGASSEFLYATVYEDGSISVLDRKDFERECEFFAHAQ